MDASESVQVERSRDFERFLTFVDAVVAIAITLLVLPLVDVAGELGRAGQNGSVLDLLRDHQAQLWAFLLSFAVIANLWFTQHHVVRTVVVTDPVVTRLMVAWLLMIVFLPFPTALVAAQGHQAATKVLYIGTMTVSSALMGLMARRIASTRSIRDSDDAPDPSAAWVTSTLFAVALAVSLVLPATGYYPLLLLLLNGGLPWAWRRLRHGWAASRRVGR
ncbi:MAG: TMEM175 family protein [Nocardioidaceae bacterium]